MKCSSVGIFVVAALLALAALGSARPEGALQRPRTIAAAADSTAAAAAAVVVDSQPEAAAHIELKLAASDSDDDHIDDQHPDDVALIGDAAAASATTAKPSPDNEQGFTSAEQTADFWRQGAQRTLREHLQQRPNTRRARNVIFFMGDGMSLPTVTAARMYMGQQRGESGEEAKLEFEQFPHVGLSKTYCVNKQTADSGCSATAYLCGIKGNYETIGVTAAVQRDNCTASLHPANRATSIVAWAQAAGKRTGVVTTTRITHASPTGTYAHTANRNWEADVDMPADGSAGECADIATQLIRGPVGRRLNVILGGGSDYFLPANRTDADGKTVGRRADGVDLIAEWRRTRSTGSRFVSTREELLRLVDEPNAPTAADSVLGLFGGDHMNFYLDADHDREPSLGEMVVAAIRRLRASADERGYLVFIEGGRIDHAHHENRARKALEETVQFSEAIRLAIGELTPAELDETLVVVTSDHAHTMSISGYSTRGADILGLNSRLAADDTRYTTLSYGTGPRWAVEANGTRSRLDGDDFGSKDYVYPSLVPLASAAHGGDDVGVFARGPWSHLFAGVYEQNVIPHVIAYAACLGEGLTVCGEGGGGGGGEEPAKGLDDVEGLNK